MKTKRSVSGTGGILVEFQAQIVDQVGHHGLGGAGGIGFAIGQPIAQVGRQMPLEERSARVFGRPHAPLAEIAAEFPHVRFDLVHDVVFVDAHNRRPPGRGFARTHLAQAAYCERHGQLHPVGSRERHPAVWRNRYTA